MKEIKKQVVEWDDTLWVVKRMIPDSYKIDIPGYKEYLGADKVVKKNGYYFFLEDLFFLGDSFFLGDLVFFLDLDLLVHLP